MNNNNNVVSVWFNDYNVSNLYSPKKCSYDKCLGVWEPPEDGVLEATVTEIMIEEFSAQTEGSGISLELNSGVSFDISGIITTSFGEIECSGTVTIVRVFEANMETDIVRLAVEGTVEGYF